MTELEILRRRRELVLLSAQLQRATVVRRLDNGSRHPEQAIGGRVPSGVRRTEEASGKVLGGGPGL